MDSLIPSGKQGAVPGKTFCWKDSGQEWPPVGHLTSGGVRLRSLRLWALSLLLPPAYLPLLLRLCKRWDLIKALTVGEYYLIFRSGDCTKHSQHPFKKKKTGLTNKRITKIRSEVKAGEKQHQGGKVEEEVIKFPLYYLHPVPTASESQQCAEIAHSHLQEITAFIIVVHFTREFAGSSY